MLNLKHLHYFWMVARCGSITKAAERLHITPQTISGQINLLEANYGVALFEPAGRGLVLTPMGEMVLGYANEIFALTDQLQEHILHRKKSKNEQLRVGIADGLSKVVVRELLSPMLHRPTPVMLICQEGRLEGLLADLAVHKLDLILADRPMPLGVSVRGYSHLLGKSTVSLMGAPNLAKQVQSFPDDLQNMPFLMPGPDTVLRQQLDLWLNHRQIYPHVIGEFADSALMTVFGQAGHGVFPVSTVVANLMTEQYGLQCIQEVTDLFDGFYAISTERTITQSSILAIVEHSHAMFQAHST